MRSSSKKSLGSPTDSFAHKNKLLQRKRRPLTHPLHTLRIQRGYTLEELARLSQISPSYLSRLESGKRRLHADNIEKLALILRCSPGVLLPSSTSELKPAPLQEDLPLYVIQESSKASLYLKKPSEWVARPQALEGIKNAFAFSITSPLLSARYRPGDRIFVDPQRPLETSCSALIITQTDDLYLADFVQCVVKQGSKEPESLVFKYCEPQAKDYKERDISLAYKDIKYLYRIIGYLETPTNLESQE